MSKFEILNDILNKLNTVDDLSFISRSSNIKKWDQFGRINYAPFLYSNSSINYQEEYRKKILKIILI